MALKYDNLAHGEQDWVTGRKKRESKGKGYLVLKRAFYAWKWLPESLRFPLFVSAVSLSAALAFSCIYYLIDARLLAGLFALLVPLHFLEMWLLLERRQVSGASWLILTKSSVFVMLAVAFIGGTSSRLLYWFAVLPLIGAMLLKQRGIVGGALLSLGSLGAIAWIERSPFFQKHMLLPPEAYFLSAYLLFFALATTISYQFTRIHVSIFNARAKKLENLLGIVTHDIASPLMVISHHAKRLKADDSEKGNGPMQSIHQACEIMQQLLDRVRKIRGIEGGKLLIPSQAVSLQEVFSKLNFMYQARLQNKGQILSFTWVNAPQDVKVLAEPVLLLNEVLGNLLSNAIKFSHNSSAIEVRVSQARRKDFVCIEVEDAGIGIPDKLLPYLFDDTKATHRLGTNGEKGSGFGLPLLKNIVNEWGGHVTIRTGTQIKEKAGCGTCFSVYLKEAQD